MENIDSKKYQVFINFRGKDERYKLAGHLKHHLIASNVNVFIDEDATGEPFKNLFNYIQKSRIAIVLLSKKYADSTWCLDELVEIKNCIETKKLDFAIPIFYKVKPSNVRNQSGKFGKNFRALQNSLRDEDGNKKTRIEIWNNALEFITGMSGLVYLKKRKSPELDFVMKVVAKVKINLAKIEAEEKSKLPRSKSMGNLEDYEKSVVDSKKPLAINVRPYCEEPSRHDMSESPPGYRRTASFRNDRDQFFPLPVDRVLPPKGDKKPPKRVPNQWSTQAVLIRLCVTVLGCWCFTTGTTDFPQDW